MARVGIVLLADTETAEGMGRMTNALITARELQEAGEGVVVIFDGAGTRWIPELSRPDHKYSELLATVRERVAGACSYCSEAYGVRRELEKSGITLLDEYAGHPSIARLVGQGYEVVTF